MAGLGCLMAGLGRSVRRELLDELTSTLVCCKAGLGPSCIRCGLLMGLELRLPPLFLRLTAEPAKEV